MSEASPQPHLEIFNTAHHCSRGGPSFTLFSQLPKELRLTIWRHTLQHHRIIKIKLEGLKGWTGTKPLFRSDDELEQAAITASVSRGERYRVMFKGSQVLSKLLRINQESRQEALSFYRVHVPCLFKKPGREASAKMPGMLYLNPEYDFLRIKSYIPLKDTLVNFLYHLKTSYDPRGIGLLNLALHANDLAANDLHSLIVADLEPKFRDTFLETFSQLREVFFMETPRGGRQVNGWQSGLLTNEVWFNRSLPIMTEIPTFDRLDRDPRPVNQDMKKVLVSGGSDPRDGIDLWFTYLGQWGISPQKVQYRFLLAFDPTISGGISQDRSAAQKWLQRDDDIWNGHASWNGDVRLQVGAEHKDWKDEDLSKAVRPAFGFWLFPIEALGPLRTLADPGDESHRREGKRVVDMTGYWPELGLSRLY